MTLPIENSRLLCCIADSLKDGCLPRIGAANDKDTKAPGPLSDIFLGLHTVPVSYGYTGILYGYPYRTDWPCGPLFDGRHKYGRIPYWPVHFTAVIRYIRCCTGKSKFLFLFNFYEGFPIDNADSYVDQSFPACLPSMINNDLAVQVVSLGNYPSFQI